MLVTGALYGILTTIYAWAGGDDINLALEENAMQKACEVLGCEVPVDWREKRRHLVKEVFPIAKLA